MTSAGPFSFMCQNLKSLNSLRKGVIIGYEQRREAHSIRCGCVLLVCTLESFFLD